MDTFRVAVFVLFLSGALWLEVWHVGASLPIQTELATLRPTCAAAQYFPALAAKDAARCAVLRSQQQDNDIVLYAAGAGLILAGTAIGLYMRRKQ
jgi:hypothetical protein